MDCGAGASKHRIIVEKICFLFFVVGERLNHHHHDDNTRQHGRQH
jgi:hypothetical protein